MALRSTARWIGWSGLAGSLAILLSGLGVEAKPAKSKKPIVIAAASATTTATATPRRSYPTLLQPNLGDHRPSVRFFTINQVLAKLDAQHGGLPTGRTVLASASAETAVDAPPPSAFTQPRYETPEPFDLFTFRAPEGALWIKWRAIEAAIEADLKVLIDCRNVPEQCPSNPARRMIEIVEQAQARDGRAKVVVANRLVNASIRYVSDLAQHGELDRWSGALSTLATGQGDCEDYAIAKYVALRLAGAPKEDLRLLLVRDRIAGDHAVLGVRHDGRWLILDNRHLMIADSTELSHFTPLFALDHQGVKLFAAPYANRGQPAQQTAPAAKSNEQAGPRHADTVALRDAGLGDWHQTPLAL